MCDDEWNPRTRRAASLRRAFGVTVLGGVVAYLTWPRPPPCCDISDGTGAWWAVFVGIAIVVWGLAWFLNEL